MIGHRIEIALEISRVRGIILAGAVEDEHDRCEREEWSSGIHTTHYNQLTSEINLVVTSIAVRERRLAGSTAEANGGVDLVFSDEGDGFEGSADMRVIAEGLVVRETARTIEVLLARLQLHAE